MKPASRFRGLASTCLPFVSFQVQFLAAFNPSTSSEDLVFQALLDVCDPTFSFVSFAINNIIIITSISLFTSRDLITLLGSGGLFPIEVQATVDYDLIIDWTVHVARKLICAEM